MSDEHHEDEGWHRRDDFCHVWDPARRTVLRACSQYLSSSEPIQLLIWLNRTFGERGWPGFISALLGAGASLYVTEDMDGAGDHFEEVVRLHNERKGDLADKHADDSIDILILLREILDYTTKGPRASRVRSVFLDIRADYEQWRKGKYEPPPHTERDVLRRFSSWCLMNGDSARRGRPAQLRAIGSSA